MLCLAVDKINPVSWDSLHQPSVISQYGITDMCFLHSANPGFSAGGNSQATFLAQQTECQHISKLLHEYELLYNNTFPHKVV